MAATAACAFVGVMFCGRGQHFCCKACTDIGYIIANCFDFIRNRTARGCCTKILSMIAICNHSHTRPPAPCPSSIALPFLPPLCTLYFICRAFVSLSSASWPPPKDPQSESNQNLLAFRSFSVFHFFNSFFI